MKYSNQNKNELASIWFMGFKRRYSLNLFIYGHCILKKTIQTRLFLKLFLSMSVIFNVSQQFQSYDKSRNRTCIYKNLITKH